MILELWPNLHAGVGAGCTPDFIEMTQVGHGCWSGSARGALGHIHTTKL